MEYIKKENGFVYLIKEIDAYGVHKTITLLGKDPDCETNEEKPKRKKKKKLDKSED